MRNWRDILLIATLVLLVILFVRVKSKSITSDRGRDLTTTTTYRIAIEWP